MKDNWQDYKLLLHGVYSPKDIVIKKSKQKIKKNKITRKVIDQSWKDMVKGRKSVGLETWGGIVYSLQSFKASAGKLILKMSEVLFEDLQGTNATHWIFGDIYGREYLANGILVQAIVLDKNDKVVLGKRISGVKSEFEKFAIFGGTLDKNEHSVKNARDFFEGMMIELREELFVQDDQLKNLTLHYLVEDWKYYPVFIFLAQLGITFKELNDKFIKHENQEHSALQAFTLTGLQKKMKETPERFSDLTLMAMDVYGKNKL